MVAYKFTRLPLSDEYGEMFPDIHEPRKFKHVETPYYELLVNPSKIKNEFLKRDSKGKNRPVPFTDKQAGEYNKTLGDNAYSASSLVFGSPTSLTRSLRQSAVSEALDYCEQPKPTKPEEPRMSEEDQKRELLFKFKLLRVPNKNITIPNFTMHSNLKDMKDSYDSCVKKIAVESSVASYRKMMMMAFWGIECGLNYINIADTSGFAAHQMMQMGEYESLLIELGEKSYSPIASNWPVEIRLGVAILMNTCGFLLQKLISSASATGDVKRDTENVSSVFTRTFAPGGIARATKPTRPDFEPNTHVSAQSECGTVRVVEQPLLSPTTMALME